MSDLTLNAMYELATLLMSVLEAGIYLQLNGGTGLLFSGYSTAVVV
jgi:hypothetical protein